MPIRMPRNVEAMRLAAGLRGVDDAVRQRLSLQISCGKSNDALQQARCSGATHNTELSPNATLPIMTAKRYSSVRQRPYQGST